MRSRSPGTSARIQVAWIEAYFRTAADPGEDEEIVLDAAAVTEWLKGAERTRDATAPPDSPDELATRVDELRTRTARSA